MILTEHSLKSKMVKVTAQICALSLACFNCSYFCTLHDALFQHQVHFDGFMLAIHIVKVSCTFVGQTTTQRVHALL